MYIKRNLKYRFGKEIDKMDKKYGFVRVGSIVPKLKVAEVDYNVEELIRLIRASAEKKISIVVTPELSICGYTCGDLFAQEVLLEESLSGLQKIMEKTKDLKVISIVGLPLRYQNKLWNVAVVLQQGKILGTVPKSYIPNYSEFYEKRMFTSGLELENQHISLLGTDIPFGHNLIFQDPINQDLSFGIEICEDLWAPNPPSTDLALNGANILFNLSASNEVIGKYDYRKNLVMMQSAKTISAYVYASSGIHESTTDVVFSGQSFIAENGSILKENERFSLESNLIYTEVDCQKLTNLRRRNTSFQGYTKNTLREVIPVEIDSSFKELTRIYPSYPFVPHQLEDRMERCQEILMIQASGLIKRLLHIGTKKTVIGISGGLDSTLALLVILKAYEKLKIDPKNIIAITMPGFGTTNQTYENACQLVKAVGATLKEISIVEASHVHFHDIGLDEKERNVTYENTQARERTQILMDVANLEGGIVIGTGDLSELALGWCTYNGDHMSMYAVNTSIPKTLIRYLVAYGMKNEKESVQKILKSILNTPISPELLPPDEYGKIVQKTEDKIGPYVLHDFFLYHFLKYGATPDKIYLLAQSTFQDSFTKEEIKHWLTVFIQRFFSQQFKRSCLPDGPKVGTISVSPRGDLRMPSDADANIWLKRIEKL